MCDKTILDLFKQHKSEIFDKIIYRFVGIEGSKHVADYLSNNPPKSDSDIYNVLRRFAPKHDTDQQFIEILNSETQRQIKLMRKLAEIIEKIETKSQTKFGAVNTMLDFGSNDCALTIAMKKQFGARDVYAADIMVPLKLCKEAGLHYVQLKNNLRSIDKLLDKTYDLITSLNVLHHTTAPLKYLAMLYGKLNVNGYMFIKEHDPEIDANSMCPIEEWHNIYTHVYKETHQMGKITYLRSADIIEFAKKAGATVAYYEAKSSGDFLAAYYIVLKKNIL